MRRTRGVVALLSSAALIAGGSLVGIVAGGNGAGAVEVQLYSAFAGGAYVKVGDNTVSSELSSPSSICCFGAQSDTGNVASATIKGLLSAQAVKTSTTATVISGGYHIVATAKLTGVNALNGLITASALTTTNDVVIQNGTVTGTTTSQFLGLHVAGHTLPKIIPDNFTLNIPGVAAVALNFSQKVISGKQIYVHGSGIAITLLKPRGTAPAGAIIEVGPSLINAGTEDVGTTGHAVGGEAYGTYVNVDAGHGTVTVQSDPTADIKLPFPGTGGQTNTRAIAGVHLNPAANVGAVTNTVEGINTPDGYEAHTTSKVAGVNLFNGLLRVDAVTADARSAGGATASPGITGDSQILNLRIAGKLIPVNTSPNTTINVANLGRITINQQIRSPHGITVRALDIVLNTGRYGLPVGSEVQVAVANAVGV